MATGICYYWNGRSGWIKLNEMSEQPTVIARDIMILASDVVSGVMMEGSAVDFDLDSGSEPWFARNLAAA